MRPKPKPFKENMQNNKKNIFSSQLKILDKALNEPAYSALYAQLCQRLDKCVPNFEPYQPPPPQVPNHQQLTQAQQNATLPISTFRKLLLTICQHEFDNRANYCQTTAAVAADEEERGAAKQLAKKKMLGNVKFIGELGRLDLLSEAILHKCIKTLLEKKKEEKYAEMCDDLECLCKMMPTIGMFMGAMLFFLVVHLFLIHSIKTH